MTIRLLAGDCRDVLPTLAADSVHCVVTSPPYYGLRDYGTALWDGGDAACDHVAGNARNDVTPERLAERAAAYGTGQGAGSKVTAMQFRDTCGKCGARRIDRQIGLESSPSEYLATMVAVFREIRRVLRSDGTVWCNLGDSYAGGPSHAHEGMAALGAQYRGGGHKATRTDKPDRSTGLAAKQLLLMPARLALALQSDGWWVRSAIVWAKPNPMPESCRDRPTSAYEMVYLLTKRATYYYDADAVREPHDAPSIGNRMDHFSKREQPRGEAPDAATRPAFANSAGGREYNPAGRNLRNVWTLPTQSFPDSHFATFPTALAERCIRAGTSERGCCAACGKPWGRITSKAFASNGKSAARGITRDPRDNRVEFGADYGSWAVTTTGWAAGCDCAGDVVPCCVLDPFAGAGTTLLVADRLQRQAVGIELNTAYTEMAMERCRADAPLFTSFPPAEDPEDSRMADLFADAEYHQLPPRKPDAFRNSDRYVNQGLQPSNGRTMPEAAE